MELLVLVGVTIIIIYSYKKLTTSTNSDKLTLLQLENWVAIYSQEDLLKKGNMATALIVQSIHLANNMGINISINEFMCEKNKNKEKSIDIIEEWLEYISSEMTNDMSLSQINAMPARTVGALLLLSLSNSSLYRDFIHDLYI